MKKNNQNEFPLSAKIFIFFILAIMVSGFIKACFYDKKLRNYNRVLQNVSAPQKIVLQYKNQVELLKDEIAEKFLNEIQSKHVGYLNTHDLREYAVLVIIQKDDFNASQYFIAPDSAHKGRFWVSVENENFKRIKSLWLEKYFEEINFFNHQKILNKS